MDIKEYKVKLYQKNLERKQLLRSERDEFITKFLEQINTKEREQYFKSKGKKYIPLTESALVGILKRRLGTTKTSVLREFYKQCEGADNFTAFFWWQIKQGANKKLL